MRRCLRISLNMGPNLRKLCIDGDNRRQLEYCDGLQQLLGTINPGAGCLFRKVTGWRGYAEIAELYMLFFLVRYVVAQKRRHSTCR